MSPARPIVSFIVPALNEERHIENTMRTILEAVAASRLPGYEIVMVDDGSADKTGALMDRLAAENQNARVIHNRHNLGFGAAYKVGVAAATGEYVMIIAGDNLMPASSITSILNLLGQADIILPYMTDSRFRPLVRRIASWTFARIINVLFGHPIRYYNSMVPRRNLLNRITIQASGYSLQAECIVKMLRGGASYKQIGVAHGHALAKSGSHALRPKNIVNVFKGIFKLICETRRSAEPSASPKSNNSTVAERDS